MDEENLDDPDNGNANATTWLTDKKEKNKASPIYFREDIIVEGFEPTLTPGGKIIQNPVTNLSSKNFSKVLDKKEGTRFILDIGYVEHDFDTMLAAIDRFPKPMEHLRNFLSETYLLYGGVNSKASKGIATYTAICEELDSERIIPKSTKNKLAARYKEKLILKDIIEGKYPKLKDVAKAHQTTSSKISKILASVVNNQRVPADEKPFRRVMLMPPLVETKTFLSNRHITKGYIADNWAALVKDFRDRFTIRGFKDKTIIAHLRKALKLKSMIPDRQQNKSSSLTNIQKQICVGSAIGRILNKKEKILFFDQSTIMAENFKNKVIGSREFVPGKYIKFGITGISFLSIISPTGFTACQFRNRGADADDVHFFLTQVLNKLCSETPKEEWGWFLVLDNASIHRGVLVKDLVSQYPINIIYTIPSSPFLNIIEDFFLSVKRNLRTSFFMSKDITLKNIGAGMRETVLGGYTWMVRKFIRNMRKKLTELEYTQGKSSVMNMHTGLFQKNKLGFIHLKRANNLPEDHSDFNEDEVLRRVTVRLKRNNQI